MLSNRTKKYFEALVTKANFLEIFWVIEISSQK